MARTTETTVHHLVDKRFVGITPDGMRVMIDGENEAQTGMRPMHLLLNAVGGCAAYDIVAMLAKRRLEVRSYTIELVGERADETPSPFTKIRALHRFDVPGLDERTARRFAELGMTKYCSVAASLKAEIEVEVELLHDQLESGAEPGSESDDA
ncbi:MAG: OsmC family protein [Trueperaceae bacterium]|nr:OsmC family protein [Trueperaceae bacterium]